jgi:hypothetical protein
LFLARDHVIAAAGLSVGRLVKNITQLSGQQLLSQASALSGRGHFLHMDAHREELCLISLVQFQ